MSIAGSSEGIPLAFLPGARAERALGCRCRQQTTTSSERTPGCTHSAGWMSSPQRGVRPRPTLEPAVRSRAARRS